MNHPPGMKLPAPAELTDDDRASIVRIRDQMDRLAASIHTTAAPDTAEVRALNGWVAFAAGSGLLTSSPHHVAALTRGTA